MHDQQEKKNKAKMTGQHPHPTANLLSAANLHDGNSSLLAEC